MWPRFNLDIKTSFWLWQIKRDSSYSAGDRLQTQWFHCLSLLITWPKIILVTVLCFISHRFALVVFRHHFLLLFFNLSALKRILSAFSSQLSFIICFHYGLFFPVTSHLSLHFPQLKIAIMDISNQVSFDFHSLSLLSSFPLILPFVHCQLSPPEMSCCISSFAAHCSVQSLIIHHYILEEKH